MVAGNARIRPHLLALALALALAALAFALALALPGRALALSGAGTAEDPVVISSTDDLKAWAADLNQRGVDYERTQHVRLGADIAVNDDVLDAMAHPDLQVASFDGDGYLITLDLTRHGALFETGGMPAPAGQESPSTKVSDVNLMGTVNVPDREYAAALFAYVNGTTDERRLLVEYCSNWATITAKRSVGGLVGCATLAGSDSLIIKRSANLGTVSVGEEGGGEGSAGGIVGYVDNTSISTTLGVTLCVNYGKVKGNAAPAGGIIGTVVDDDASTETPAAGHADIGSACLNEGKVSSSDSPAAGILGLYRGVSSRPLEITSACARGKIEGTPRRGIYGKAESGTVKLAHCMTLKDAGPGQNPESGIAVSSWEMSKPESLAYLNAGGYYPYIKHSVSDHPVLEDVGKARVVLSYAHYHDVGDRTEQVIQAWGKPARIDDPAEPEDMAFAYWTPEKPDEGYVFSKPPQEIASDESDPHAVMLREKHFYAYYTYKWATVNFYVNAPEGATCTMSPEEPASKTIEGHPMSIGYLPTPECTSGDYVFTGWCTQPNPEDGFLIEPYDNFEEYMDEEGNILALYALWQPKGNVLSITKQPEDATVQAWFEDDRANHTASFRCEFKNEARDSPPLITQWERLDMDFIESVRDAEPVPGADSAYFDLVVDEPEDAEYLYRLKITRPAFGNVPETVVYSKTVSVIVDTGPSSVEITAMNKAENPKGVLYDWSECEYDFSLALDSRDNPMLGDEEKGGPFYLVVIDGVMTHVVSTSTPSFTSIALVQGRSYDVKVQRVVKAYNHWIGEGDWGYTRFIAPYQSVKPLDPGQVVVTVDQPLGPDGEVLPVEKASDLRVGNTFFLVVDSKWKEPIPEGRPLSARWLWEDDPEILPGYFVEIPDDFDFQHHKDEAYGQPYQSWWQNEDGTWSSRIYTPFTVGYPVSDVSFRAALSTPPSSDEVLVDLPEGEEFSSYLTPPQNVHVKLDEETLVATVTWDWPEEHFRSRPDQFVVTTNTSNSAHKPEVYVDGDEYKAEVQLQPQTNYEVKVSAYCNGYHETSEPVPLTTKGDTSVTLSTSSPVFKEGDSIYANFNWAAYNDNEYDAVYRFYFSTDLTGDTWIKDREFNQTEHGEVVSYKLPGDFDSSRAPEAMRVKVTAELINQHSFEYKKDTYVESAPMDIIWDSDIWNNSIDVKGGYSERGTHSLSLTWEGNKEHPGRLLAYRIAWRDFDDPSAELQEAFIPSDRTAANAEYTVKGLDPDTTYTVWVHVVDPRAPDVELSWTSSSFDTKREPVVGVWTAQTSPDTVVVDDPNKPLRLSVVEGDFDDWLYGELLYAWQKWDAASGAWVADGEASESRELVRTARADDIGGLWRCVTTASTSDTIARHVSNTVSPSVEPPAPSDLALDGEARADALPLQWSASSGADGYVLTCEKQASAGGSATPGSGSGMKLYVREGDYTVEEGVVRYALDGLDPDTAYRLHVAATALSATTLFSDPLDATTAPDPALKPPFFDKKPALVVTTVGGAAAFSVRAHDLEDEDARLAFRWERMGLGESAFVPVEPSAYAVQDDADGKGSKLSIAALERADVGAAFRCVAVREAGGERVEVASPQARVLVRVRAPHDVSVGEAGRTSARVSWTPREGVSRYLLQVVLKGPDGDTTVRRSLVQLTDEEIAAGRVSRQLTALKPATSYAVTMMTAPPGEFNSSESEPVVFVTQPEEGGIYEVIEGAGGTWKPGGEVGLAFRIDAALESFVAVLVDDIELSQADFDLTAGSTVVTLRPAFLEGLSAGAHTLTAKFADGTAVATFTVDKPVDKPSGDTPGGDAPGGDVPGGDSGDSGADGQGDGRALAPTGDPLASVPAVGGALAAVAGLALVTSVWRRRRNLLPG